MRKMSPNDILCVERNICVYCLQQKIIRLIYVSYIAARSVHNAAFTTYKRSNVQLTSNTKVEVGDIDTHVILRSAGVDAEVMELDTADVQHRHKWILFTSVVSSCN